ncbi:MAG TPA: SdpI family protein, partial [Luteolibacter sp.]
MTAVAIALLVGGLVIFLASLPLAYRKVPMNQAYGIRIQASFESEQRWYDINAYGGRRMAAWAWLIIFTGVLGFFVP